MVDDIVYFTYHIRYPPDGSERNFDPKELAREYYKFARQVRKRIRDARRHLILNRGCPFLLLVFRVVEDGNELYFTKLLLLKSNFYVYAFFSAGRWKAFQDCPYILVAEDGTIAENLPYDSEYVGDCFNGLTAKDIDLSISELFYGKDDKKCREKVLKLIVMFVEAFKCHRIYEFIYHIVCGRVSVGNASIREVWLIGQWATMSKWLYLYYAEKKWEIPNTIDSAFFKLPADREKQIKKCMGTILIIKRPSLEMDASDLKNLDQFTFEFSSDSPGELLVNKYQEFISWIRSQGEMTMMDVSRPFILKFKMFAAGGGFKKSSFLLFRENFEFVSIKVKGEWFNFFNSPYVLKNKHGNLVKRLDYYPASVFDYTFLSKNTFISALDAVFSGDFQQIKCWAHLYFIFIGGSIFPRIEAFVCSAFLSSEAVEIEEYYFKLLLYWEFLSSYLHLNDGKKLPHKLAIEMDFPIFDNEEEQVLSDRNQVRQLLAIIHC